MRSPSAIHTQLTEAKVAKLANDNPSSDLFARDTSLHGFGLRISPKNVKSFFVEATVQGRFIRRVIGRYPFTTVAEAHKRALEALRIIKYDGGSLTPDCEPVAVLKEVVDTFLRDKEDSLRPSTLADYSMVLKGKYFAPWMSSTVISISRRQVLDRYRVIALECGPGMANEAFRVLSAAFNYGRALYPALENWPNPIRVLAETRAKVALRPRTSHIKQEDLPKWLSALDAYRDETTAREGTQRRSDIWLFLHLVLMTGLRSNEARSLMWSDIDLEHGVLTIRESIAKNHIEAHLPLNAWLTNQLSNRKRSCEGRVFPSSCNVGYLNNLRRALKRIEKLSGIRVMPHDLRRTFATYLDLIGAPFGAIKQLLNHVSQSDVTAQYIQRRAIDELRQYSERVLAFIMRTP